MNVHTVVTRSRRLLRNSALCLLLAGATTPSSWAWGRAGHRLTALVADQYLTPQARAAIKELLHGQDISEIASWADEVRTAHPETGKWHYVDTPRDQPKFNRDRDCPLNAADPKSPWRDCVTDRILYFEGRLGDDSLPPEQRAEALKYLVHFIGDVHQPFHAIGDARGGNDISVSFLGSPQCGNYKCNLHGVWDESILDHEGLNDKKFVDLLMKTIQDRNLERLSGGEPTTWANVSHHYAAEAFPPSGALLTSEYVKEETQVVNVELALGGLRLARVLNRILAPPPVEDATPADSSGRAPLPRPAAAAPAPPTGMPRP